MSFQDLEGFTRPIAIVAMWLSDWNDAMAFADPQTITISGTTIPLPNTFREGSTGIYRSADGLTILKAQHQYGRRVRDVARVEVSKTVADPLQPSLNRTVGGTVQISFDFSDTGYTNADKKAVFDGLIAQLNASSAAVLNKLLGGES